MQKKQKKKTYLFIICLYLLYRGTDKSLARPTFRCILFDGENISFDASLVIYTYIVLIFLGARWHSSLGTTLKTGRSRDRFPMVSLEFFSDITLPVALSL